MKFGLSENWRIDETRHAGEEHLDTAYVEGYDRKAQFDPAEDIHWLIQLGLSKSSRVIDFGAGTGTFAMAVAPHCLSVIAVDPSPAMTARLQESVAEAGLQNVSISRSGFLSYNPPAKPVDFIFTRNALHHLPDFWKVLALSRMRAMLAPGGILRIKDIVFDFGPEQTQEKLEEWMAGAVSDSGLGWTAEELAEHVRKEYSTFRWLFEPMLQRTGFEIMDRNYHRHVYGTYTCRTRP